VSNVDPTGVEYLHVGIASSISISAVEESSNTLTTSPMVLDREKKRAASVVVECRFDRSETLRTV
jgi:hypothetical protein